MFPKNLKNIGIEDYTTSIERGIGGKLRERYEDFIVNELHYRQDILGMLRKYRKQGSPKFEWRNKVHFYQLDKKGLDTLSAIEKIGKDFGLKPIDIRFAGMKDKQAMTSQLMCFRSPKDFDSSYQYESGRLRLNYVGSLNRMLEIGDLLGNSFHITIRNIESNIDRIHEEVRGIWEEIEASGGFLNYFGTQRFGDVRPNTHIIGRYLIRGEFQQAVDELLTTIYPLESSEDHKARSRLARERDYQKALEFFPKSLNFERKVIQALLKNEGDPTRGFDLLPSRLKTLFIFAYQSFLFNRFLSRRKSLGLPFNEARKGDQVMLLDEHGLPSNVIFDITQKNEKRLNDLISKKEAVLCHPLVGFKSQITQEYIQQVLDEEKTSPAEFQIQNLPELSSRGSMRPILCQPMNFEVRAVTQDELNSGKMKAILRFALRKGCYATILLKEFMKK